MKLLGIVLTMLGTLYRPKISVFANFCSMFLTFQKPEIQLALVWLLPTPNHQHTAIETSTILQRFC